MRPRVLPVWAEPLPALELELEARLRVCRRLAAERAARPEAKAPLRRRAELRRALLEPPVDRFAPARSECRSSQP